MEWDRAEMLDYGRSRGFYIPTRRSLLVEDPAAPRVRGGGRWVPVVRLDAEERRQLLVTTADGRWEPAMVWLNQWGLPMTMSGWKQVFADANARCRAQGVDVKATPHMLRHWFIARRSGGTIPGALQYRHQRIQMFEGYAGTGDSGFRDEVEAEEAFGLDQFLAELGADDDRPSLTGPAGEEAEARLAELARHTVFDGRVVTAEARLRRILARHDTRLYPGTFITCVYNPDRALCRTSEGPADQPVMADRKPPVCRNTALTPANLQALTGHFARLEDALSDSDRLAPYVRHRLEERHRATAAFLTCHAPETAE